jgi:hypothetical protein
VLALGDIPTHDVSSLSVDHDVKPYQRGDSGHMYTKQQTMTAGSMAELIMRRQLRPVMPAGSGTL